MGPSNILKALANDRLPNELVKMIFEYVACDNTFPATAIFWKNDIYTNTRHLAKLILDHSRLLNENLINIMEEVVLESQDLLLDITNLDDHPNLNSLDSSQLTHVRSMTLAVYVEFQVMGSRVSPSLMILTFAGRRLRRIVSMAKTHLHGLKSFRLVLDYRFESVFLVHKISQISLFIDSQREISNRVWSGLHSIAPLVQCKVQIRMTHAGIEREGCDIDFQQDGSQTLARAIHRFGHAYMNHSDRIAPRIGQYGCDPDAQLRNLKLICSEADPGAPIWDFDSDRNDCNIFTYAGAFQKAIYMAPAYIRHLTGEPCTQPRPKLRQHTQEEIQARFIAAGGYVASRTMTKLWPIEEEKLNLLVLGKMLGFTSVVDLVSLFWGSGGQ